VVTPHFVKPLSPDEKAKLPDFAETFLPTIQEQKGKGGKKGAATAQPQQAPDPKKAQFVGPRGYEEPK
jgi:hypothetical protein